MLQEHFCTPCIMGLPACEGITAGKGSSLPHVLMLRIPIIAV